jgi:hypothetical protein
VLKFLEGKIAKWWTPDDVQFVDAHPARRHRQDQQAGAARDGTPAATAGWRGKLAGFALAFAIFSILWFQGLQWPRSASDIVSLIAAPRKNTGSASRTTS